MEPFEPPKYIGSLIAAINDGAKSAQLGALAFTAIGLFLLATAFSATDEDLLLNHVISISQLGGAQVPVVFAFGLAPAVFLAAHLYTLIRYDMLAGNVRQLLADLPGMVPVEVNRERCRQLLANVEFVNALVMPATSRSSSWLFRLTVTMLIAVFPVTVLLLVQISSLRLQHEVVNWTHHACLAIDLVLLVWFFGRLRGDDGGSFWTSLARRKAALCWLPVAIIVMDLAWLQVPGPDSDTMRSDIVTYRWPMLRGTQLDWRLAVLVNLPRQPIDLLVCRYVGWGCRFLTVAYRPVVAKVWDSKGFVELRGGAEANDKSLGAIEGASLRERVLRFAVLTGSELIAADLNGAELQYADLSNTNLKRAVLERADLHGARLFEAQLQDADLYQAQLQGVQLEGAQLQGAILIEAQLQGASMNNESGLNPAQMQGAYMFGAQLQGAYMDRVNLQGAGLMRAQLQGAKLGAAELQGAHLNNANLWNVTMSSATQIGLADLRGVKFAAPQADDLVTSLPADTPESVRETLRHALNARPDAGMLPRGIATTLGPMLVSSTADRAWRDLQPGQITTNPADIDPALATLLADTVAPASPGAAETIALHVIASDEGWDLPRQFGQLLECRLLANAKAGRVTLTGEMIAKLRTAAGVCE